MRFFRPRRILLRNKQIWEETIIILTKCHPNTDTLSIKPGSSYLLYNPYFLFSPRKRSKSLKFIGFVYKKREKVIAIPVFMRFFAAERWSISFSISITRFLLPAQRRFCKLSVSLILLLLNHLPESFISFISFFIIFTMNIYVGNLSYRVKEADLQQVMEDYGTVTSCKVIMDRETGKSKGSVS